MKAASHRAKIRNAIRKSLAITRMEEDTVIAAIEKSLRLGAPAKGRKPDPADASTWPVMWRVIAPRAGNYNYDLVFHELEDDEKHARTQVRRIRRAGYPVRLERVQCGPFPRNGIAKLQALRDQHTQNPKNEKFPLMPGDWEAS